MGLSSKTTIPAVVIEAGKRLHYDHAIIVRACIMFNKYSLLLKKLDVHDKILAGAVLYLAVPDEQHKNDDLRSIINVLYNMETGKIIDLDGEAFSNLKETAQKMIIHISKLISLEFMLPQEVMAIFLKTVEHHGMGEALMRRYSRSCMIVLLDYAISMQFLRYQPEEVCIAVMDLVKRTMNVTFAPILEKGSDRWQKLLWSEFDIMKTRRIIKNIHEFYGNELRSAAS